MAVEYVRCVVCGSSKKPAVLLGDTPLPAAALVTSCSQPGKKGREWSTAPLALSVAQALRRRVAAALARLDEEIKAAEEG
jgi:hypothetical protein